MTVGAMPPDVEPVRLYRILKGLRHVRRFSRLPVAQPQSVAEHCFLTAILAGCFAEQLSRSGVPEVSKSIAIEGALWHDAAEAITGDLPHDYKRWHAELYEQWEAREQEVLELIGGFNGGLTTALKNPCLESLIVKMADCVELVLYVQTEGDVGNHSLDIAAERIWEYLNITLREQFGSGPAGVWYAKALEDLRAAVPFTRGARRHDPLILLEGGDDP